MPAPIRQPDSLRVFATVRLCLDLAIWWMVVRRLRGRGRDLVVFALARS